MASDFEVIVVGLGAMGSAAAWQIAKRGRRVLAIDRYSPPHAFGSSHGETRITRLAIGEGAMYTPLALRSHEIWREIEAATGESLLVATGGLVISSAAERAQCHVPGFFASTVSAARSHGIRHELLDAPAIRGRFPQFDVSDDEVGYYEPEAGFLRPERCVAAQIALAERSGAVIRRDEKVLRIEESGAGVKVATDRAEYGADGAIVAAGPWLPELIGDEASHPFKVTRQMLFWFDVSASYERYTPGRFPIFIWEIQGAPQPIYGFPAVNGAVGGIKIGTEYEEVTTPETVDREASPAAARSLHESAIAKHLPGVGANCLRGAVCLYTETPDHHFVIDRHPSMPRVVIASPCSGHGFKHSAALGEALAGLALDGRSPIGLSAFSLSRFAGREPAPDALRAPRAGA